MTDRRKARTWAEIDLGAMAHNYRALKALTPAGCGFLGLVKADAYGHGAVPVAEKLQELGADMLAVACAAEGEELRRGGIVLPILCLGQTDPALAQDLLDWNITQTVEDLESAQALSRVALAAGKRLRVHLKVDTGMGRLGFLWGDGENGSALEKMTALCALPGLEVEGMFTHFAAADEDETYTAAQLRRFLEAKKALEDRGLHFAIYHCGASAAVLHYGQSHMDMIRPGIALYGFPPAPGIEAPGLIPVMTLKSRVAAVRPMPAGSPISYGCTAVLERDSRVAVLPVGYGDGLPRSLSNKLQVQIGDRLCPVLGRICMDMCMVDVTDLPDVAPGDVARIYGPGLPQRAADQAETIVYELLCQLSRRVPRIYLDGGREIR